MGHRFVNECSLATVAGLHDLAREAGLNPMAMCLAWSKQHDFVASTIFGATTMAQLEENLGASDLILSPDVLAKTDELSLRYPYPLG
ncbi:MAG: aldo/keto reductase [Candidatus Synoicihabitans palmerolidicus]|nr:aldo/keto reductase [Candidatus Synoicihabitans palmerolidicus]